jgi:putative nucleotidyltransferase with HDIG domain
MEVIVGLINSLEAKDRYTKGHSRRVAEYAVQLARALGYCDEGLLRVEQAALLHDIGKLAIPDAILNKPGPLTAQEMEFVRSHPARGCAIIEEIESLADKLPGIRHHHEWMDGSGYPDHLAGDGIPLDARIIAVADVYDAITSWRAYRQPLKHAAAIVLLRREAGAHLDPCCVRLFVELCERQPLEITDFTPQLSVDELLRTAIGEAISSF